jgi:hypothetical protein
MAELAVVDDVDPGVTLTGDHVDDRLCKRAPVVVINRSVKPAALRAALDQAMRARQAPRMAGQDPQRHLSF